MDIEMAVSASFRRLARGRATHGSIEQFRRGLQRLDVAPASTLVDAATPPDRVMSATRRQTLHILMLAKSRLSRALAISDAIR